MPLVAAPADWRPEKLARGERVALSVRSRVPFHSEAAAPVSTSTPLLTTSLDGLQPTRQGKVRDIYDAGEALVFIATDRISAFDYVLGSGIPDKGRVLGIPAQADRETKRQWVGIQQLPEMIRRMRELEKLVSSLSARLEGATGEAATGVAATCAEGRSCMPPAAPQSSCARALAICCGHWAQPPREIRNARFPALPFLFRISNL